MPTKKITFRYQNHLRISFAITASVVVLLLVAAFFAIARIEASSTQINGHIVADIQYLQKLKLDLLDVQKDIEVIQNHTLLESPQTARSDFSRIVLEVRRVIDAFSHRDFDDSTNGRFFSQALEIFDSTQQRLDDNLDAQNKITMAGEYVSMFSARIDEKLVHLDVQQQTLLKQLENTFSFSRWSIFALSLTLLLIALLNFRFMSAAISSGAKFLQRSITERTAALERSKQAVLTVLQQERNSQEHLLEKQAQLHRANNALEESMAELNRTQKAMARQEKLASIGHLAAGVAHEINNPLGFILSNINRMHEYITDLSELITEADKQLASGNYASLEEFYAHFQQLMEDKDVEFIKDDLPSLITDCKEGGVRVTDIIQSLKDFSRIDNQDDEFQEANLLKIIRKTLNLLRNEMKYDVDLKIDCDPDLQLEVLPGPLAQVLSNMLINATHATRATERAGEIRITAFTDNQHVVLKVADNGCGIAPQHRQNIFDPFFTTKKAGEGTGLGMNIAYDIVVNRHGGEISVDSEPGVGSEFTIKLPLNPVNSQSRNTQTPPSLAVGT